MKIRFGFVSNSSSTSFVIINKSTKIKTLVDFVKENPQFIQIWKDRFYDKDEFTQDNLLKSAEKNNIVFDPNSQQIVTFGDEDGTLIGMIFDYILREGGKSKSFEWFFSESHR